MGTRSMLAVITALMTNTLLLEEFLLWKPDGDTGSHYFVKKVQKGKMEYVRCTIKGRALLTS